MTNTNQAEEDLPMKDYTAVLRSLMQTENIPSYRALATQANVSRWQLQQLRASAIGNMKIAVVASLANALNVSVNDLLNQFGVETGAETTVSDAGNALRHEYERLQKQMIDQKEVARSQFQSEALQTIETWLRQWPTIAKRAQEKGDALPAVKILPFVKPIETLMAEWNVEAIAPVDAEIPYDPQLHQLKGGTAEPGELVRVTHTGRLHKSNLLHRAEVKRL